jgi:RND family efflux transporter MFP subunit
VNVGTMVVGAPQATQIVNIIDISKLKVKVNVAEKDVFQLHVGDPVEVTTDVFPEAVLHGTIFSISSKGDDGHTYPIEVLLNNPNQKLKAGMFVNVTMKPKTAGMALLIPRSAIMGSLRDPKIFVVKDNIAKIRTVVAVKADGTNVEIANGLQEGELVVTDGQNSLSDGVSVVVRK